MTYTTHILKSQWMALLWQFEPFSHHPPLGHSILIYTIVDLTINSKDTEQVIDDDNRKIHNQEDGNVAYTYI